MYYWIIKSFCLVVVFNFVHSQMKIRGLTSKRKVADDFLIVFDLNADNSTLQIQDYTTKLKTTVKDAQVTREYRLGDFVAVRAKLPEHLVNEAWKDHPHVKYIEANQEVHLFDADTDLGQCITQKTGNALWGLSRISSRAKPNYNSATYNYLGVDGSGVDVYILDTGIYGSHVEFLGRSVQQVTVSSLVSESQDPLNSDTNGHGTHVAGIIAGNNYGVAKKANIIAVKGLNKRGIGTVADILEGLEWIYTDFSRKKKKYGAKAKGVVNMSLGGAPGTIDTLDEAAITTITSSGLPFVIAAGNDKTDACSVSPARLTVALTVAAMDSTDSISTYSNFGPCIDIMAPGDAIRSSFIGAPDAHATLTGTSMATPHVTGVIARMLSQVCYTPSPATIKAWVTDLSTSDILNLRKHESTPNRILFMDCVADGLTPGVANPYLVARPAEIQSNPTQERYNFIFMIAIAAMGFVTIVSLVTTCIVLAQMGKVKSIVKKQNAPSLVRARDYDTIGYQQYYHGRHNVVSPVAPPSDERSYLLR